MGKESNIFNLNVQNENSDAKLLAVLERLSDAIRLGSWEDAKKFQLSPLQLRILIFIKNHDITYCKVSYLAKEFHVTKPTLSDALKALEKKNLVRREKNHKDARSTFFQLTTQGKSIHLDNNLFSEGWLKAITNMKQDHREALLHSSLLLVEELQKAGLIEMNRMCLTCAYYEKRNTDVGYCKLLTKPLKQQDIRIDCPEHEAI